MTKKQEVKVEAAAQERKPFKRVITRDLECALEKEDIEKRAAQTLQVNQDRKAEISTALRLRGEAESLKSKAKELQSEARCNEEEADRLMEELDDLIRATTDKVEKRPVKCEELHDYKANKIMVTRLDNLEVIEEREMKISERQQALSFELEERQQGQSGYKDKRGRLLFISDGLSDGEKWGTYYRAESGSLKRFNAKGLEPNESRDVAERDLVAYADKHSFERIESNLPKTTSEKDIEKVA